MAIPAAAIAAARKYGHLVDDIAAQYTNPVTGEKLTGTALLLKLSKGEANYDMGAVSSAGARGAAQFMPSSRQEAIRKFGVDPWKNLDSAFHGAALHLLGKINGTPGLKGYNPGMPTYTNYILGQRVGRVSGGGTGDSSGKGGSVSPPKAGGKTTSKAGGSRGSVSVPVSASASATVQGMVPSTGGGTGLADLLSSLSAPRSKVPMSGPPIQAPATSSERYLTPGTVGPVPTGLMQDRPSGASGVAQQLAAMIGPGPEIGTPGQTASATATGTLPKVTPPKVTAPKGKVPVTAAASPVTGGSGKRSAADAVAWAQSTVGVSESTGPNRGPRVDQWQKAFGMQGQFWCAMWTSLAATKGGMVAAGRTARVEDVRNAAKTGSAAYQKGFVNPRNAKPGDLILFANDHIGMVERNTGKGLVMIAGNDSNRVNRRTIAYGNGDIVRPKYGRK